MVMDELVMTTTFVCERKGRKKQHNRITTGTLTTGRHCVYVCVFLFGLVTVNFNHYLLNRRIFCRSNTFLSSSVTTTKDIQAFWGTINHGMTLASQGHTQFQRQTGGFALPHWVKLRLHFQLGSSYFSFPSDPLLP